MEVKPGYKQTEIGMIPREWDVGCVGDSFDVCNQLRLPISQSVRERTAGPYPYYGPTSVQGWINEYRVEGEYALIGEDGDHFLKWCNQPMTLLVRGKFNVNNHAHLVRGTKNLTQWFYWFFANRDITPFLTRQGAGRYKLTKAALLQMPCAVPPVPEQNAIAGALSGVDALIGALDKLIAKKRDLKQAAIQQLLTGQTRLPGFSGEWEVKRFGEIALPRAERIDPRRAGIQGFCVELDQIEQATGRLFGSTATDEHSSLKSVFRTGDVLFGKLRAYLRKYWLAVRDGVCSTEIWAFAGRGRMVTPEFLFQMVQVEDFIEAASIAYGTHMPRSDWNIVKNYEAPLPSVKEQTAIAAVLSDMDAGIAAPERRLAKTRALKQGMMQELLTGRTRLI
jgi:type I restriction enzyme S subunit